MKLVAAVVLLCLPLVWGHCDFPPSLWCSSKEISIQCNVFEQCNMRSLRLADAGPVNLTLYYESLCPDCKRFISNQLYKTWQVLGSDVINITMIPYGNAHEVKSPFGDWKFTCQHGPEECVGNVIQTCAIDLLKNFTTYFTFIHCMELSSDLPEVSSEACAKSQGLDYNAIKNCAEGTKGVTLEHKMALQTDALNPAHRYVPWLVINGVHTEHMNDKAIQDLLSLICDMYKGPVPAGCQHRNSVTSKSWRN